MRTDPIEVAPEDTLGEVAERMSGANVGAVDRQGLRPADRHPDRARHAEGDGGSRPHERGARAASG